MPFRNSTLEVRTSDGRSDELMENLYYDANNGAAYRVPDCATTDGLSVPRLFQNIIPPTGSEWFSGILHDAAYRGTLERLQDLGWQNYQPTRLESDRLLLESLESQGVGRLKRWIIFLAVRLGGHSSFKPCKR